MRAVPRQSEGNDPHEYDVRVECITENPKSIVLKDLCDKEFCIPKSVIHDDSEVWKFGDKGRLIVKTWWAEKEGWD